MATTIPQGTRNVIPGEVVLKGDTRSYSPVVQALLRDRMAALVAGICSAHGASHDFAYTFEFEPTVNAPECLPSVAEAAAEVAGPGSVDSDCRPVLASEDFGAFLRLIPGNFLFLGSGVDALPLHNPRFDFNDNLLLPGARYLAAIARKRLQV
jgi:hippurate hydrolase